MVPEISRTYFTFNFNNSMTSHPVLKTRDARLTLNRVVIKCYKLLIRKQDGIKYVTQLKITVFIVINKPIN